VRVRLPVLKVKSLIREIREISSARGIDGSEEHRTPDNTRIDLALLRNGEPLVAVEFERTYKWIRRRILYNAVKANRGGFERLLMIYPFKKDGIEQSWVFDFSHNQLGVDIALVHPEKAMETLSDIIETGATSE
jgi:hypothetical protein